MNTSTCANEISTILTDRNSLAKYKYQIPWYRTMIREIKKYWQGSVSFGDRIADMLEDLEFARNEHSKPNWDGEGAFAINTRSYYNGMRFLMSLPQGINKPRISVDPDGEISMEWFVNSYRIFSVSFGINGELTYAGRHGASETWGVEYLSDKIPDNILSNINRLEMD
jgi:hypothetical protein